MVQYKTIMDEGRRILNTVPHAYARFKRRRMAAIPVRFYVRFTCTIRASIDVMRSVNYVQEIRCLI